MPKAFIFFFCLFTTFVVEGTHQTLKVPLLDEKTLNKRPLVHFSLEHARSQEELCWGLMQRSYLPSNHGMLFHYDRPQRVTFWMFNCAIDLSLAFIDGNHIIREIHTLKAYPERMDPRRPVCCLRELSLYPLTDPIVQFFQSRGISSSFSVKHALEMNKLWFRDNGVKTGDVLLWNEEKGSIVPTLNLSHFCSEKMTPLMIRFSSQDLFAAWIPDYDGSIELGYFDKELRCLNRQLLSGGLGSFSPVIYSSMPIHYLLIAPIGWLAEQKIQIGTEIDLPKFVQK